MKKAISIIITLFIAAAMLVFLHGCQNEKN